MPVRLGVPTDVKGLKEEISSPSFATTVGLLHYAQQSTVYKVQSEEKGSRPMDAGSILGSMKSWFKASF